MYALRQWSVRHARGLNAFYKGFESCLVRLHPLLRRIGYQRLERPDIQLRCGDVDADAVVAVMSR